jgi:hypothetical protein
MERSFCEQPSRMLKKSHTGRRRTSGAKAREWFQTDTARLKSCPDTKQNISAACQSGASFQAAGDYLYAAPLHVTLHTRRL